VQVDAHRVAQLRVDGLAAGTSYTYRVLADDKPDDSRGRGSFRTPADGPTSFRIAFAACARTGSNGAVFDAIRSESPLMYFALGDLHYSNIESTSTGPFLNAYDDVLTRAAQAALYREVPVAYVWDDHDYGPNDAGASSPGRSAVRAAYRSTVPHYDVPAGDAPIFQAFTIGRVRFIITDSRSEHTADTMLGATQLQWLLDELRRSSETHALVVWASSVPWIGEARPGDDAWAGESDERRLVADAIAESKIDNLVMLAGDAHMVAADDGTNSDYSTAGGGGFPVFHAAALDRPGSVKGGPYSEGTMPGSGQFGLLDVEDDGGPQITIRFAGRNWKGDVLMTFERTFAVL
jgi:phosphodiesterase/alkaline phosphatase D-like protein